MLRNLLCVVCACLMAVYAADAKKSQQNKVLRVASYNLRFNNPDDGENAWPNRKERVKDLIRYHKFDIIGTQEGLIEQLQDIISIGGYAYVGVGRDDGNTKGEHSAIIYRTDRFKVLDNGTVWLSETPDKPSYGWDAQIRRVYTWAKMEDLQTKQIFYFFNTHFDHQGPVARRESAKQLSTALRTIPGDEYPVICTGDFNSTPDQEPIKIMKGGMKSSRDISPFVYGPKGTYAGFLVGLQDGKTEIDYVFVNNKVNVIDYAVLSDSNGKYYPSDHMPVVVNMTFK